MRPVHAGHLNISHIGVMQPLACTPDFAAIIPSQQRNLLGMQRCCVVNTHVGAPSGACMRVRGGPWALDGFGCSAGCCYMPTSHHWTPQGRQQPALQWRMLAVQKNTFWLCRQCLEKYLTTWQLLKHDNCTCSVTASTSITGEPRAAVTPGGTTCIRRQQPIV